MLKKNKELKLIILGLIIIIVLMLVFFLNNNKKEDKPINNNNENLYTSLFVISGDFACLPVKDDLKPHNDLCVFGLKNNDNYYRLEDSSNDKFNILGKVNKGQKIEVSGKLINEEGDEYLSLGTIKVFGVKYLETEGAEINSNLPENFKADYISFSNYSLSIFKIKEYLPQEFKVLDGEIDCDETPLESSNLTLRLNKKDINNKKYCIKAFSEGAAGSVYTEYTYATVIDSHIYSIHFLANYPNCPNYPDKERLECEAERESFNLDILVDQEIERMIN